MAQPNRRSRNAAIAGLGILAVAMAAFLAGADPSAGEGSNDPSYVVYAGCGADAATHASHLCHKGDPIGAFFRSVSTDTVYEACIRFPSRKRRCTGEQVARSGVLYVNELTSRVVGKTEILWKVGSTPIGSWTVGLYPDPVVPRFGISPLFVEGRHTLYGLLIRHGGARTRVRAWATCGAGNSCPLHLDGDPADGGARELVVSAPSSGAHFRLGDRLYVQLDAPGQTDGHGSRIWGRLYTGRFVRAAHGGPGDSAIRHIGTLRCVPPGKSFDAAVACDHIP